MRAERMLWVKIAIILLWQLADSTAARHKAGRAKGAFEQAAPEPALHHKLDIVIAHYYEKNLNETLKLWTKFLNEEKVKELKPYVYFYCQNEGMLDLGVIAPLVRRGEVVHLENLGREGHVYLNHIITHYDTLADHTIFTQAIPDSGDRDSDEMLKARFLNLFRPNTGMLSLGVVGHMECEDAGGWLPRGQIMQLHSLLTRRMCPPEGYTAFFNGEFLVSRHRIHLQPHSVYKYLKDMLVAPIEHWIHSLHDDAFFKNTSRPFFGHSLERSWNLAFDCYELWREWDCYDCDHSGYTTCRPEDCQCLD